jgi:hypothetical protein
MMASRFRCSRVLNGITAYVVVAHNFILASLSERKNWEGKAYSGKKTYTGTDQGEWEITKYWGR